MAFNPILLSKADVIHQPNMMLFEPMKSILAFPKTYKTRF
jgi:hypothetical protein